MASGDMPDVVEIDSPDQNYHKWAGQGAFLELDQYIEQFPTFKLVPQSIMHNRKYLPAMQVFHVRLAECRLPLAEAKFEGYHQKDQGFLFEGVWERPEAIDRLSSAIDLYGVPVVVHIDYEFNTGKEYPRPNWWYDGGIVSLNVLSKHALKRFFSATLPASGHIFLETISMTRSLTRREKWSSGEK